MRFRVYPTEAQVERLGRWEDALRFLWNLATEQRLLGRARERAERKHYSLFEQQRDLTELRAELPWLADVPRDACNSLLTHVEHAWQRWGAGLTKRPRFKRKGRDPVSVCEPHFKAFRVVEGNLYFPKLGNIRCVMHRPLQGRAKKCALLRDGNQWFASVVCEQEVPDPPLRSEPMVAIDRGVINVAADSDGVLVSNPRYYERIQGRIARAQRELRRRKLGSKNRDKSRAKIAALHRIARRQREHFVQSLSFRYANSHGTVVVERLDIEHMLRGNRGTARSISGAGWGRFVQCLRYKLAWSGGSLIEVPAQYSSQTCAACSAVDASSRRGESFVCTSCGHRDHADLNAAKVLKARANRSCQPTEASGLPSRRSGKVKLRVVRRSQAPRSSRSEA